MPVVERLGRDPPVFPDVLSQKIAQVTTLRVRVGTPRGEVGNEVRRVVRWQAGQRVATTAVTLEGADYIKEKKGWGPHWTPAGQKDVADRIFAMLHADPQLFRRRGPNPSGL